MSDKPTTRGKHASSWIDVSVPLRPGMAHWPGDPAPRITRAQDMERGDAYTTSFLEMGAHTGTHMDAPAHVLHRGATIDAMPLDAGVGTARVIGIRDAVSVTVRELRPHRIRRGERILFKTRNSLCRWNTGRFHSNFVYISAGAARYLAERKVRLVGVDYLSVGGFKKDGLETHEALLGAGIWIIEGLNLSKLTPGPIDMICLPLKLLNADGAPARAIARMKRT